MNVLSHAFRAMLSMRIWLVDSISNADRTKDMVAFFYCHWCRQDILPDKISEESKQYNVSTVVRTKQSSHLKLESRLDRKLYDSFQSLGSSASSNCQPA